MTRLKALEDVAKWATLVYEDPRNASSRAAMEAAVERLLALPTPTQRAGSDTEGSLAAALEAVHAIPVPMGGRHGETCDWIMGSGDCDCGWNEYCDDVREQKAKAIAALNIPTTPATSDEGEKPCSTCEEAEKLGVKIKHIEDEREKPPQRSLEVGTSSKGLSAATLPQGQRAEQIENIGEFCECLPSEKMPFGGFRIVGSRVICNRCNKPHDPGNPPTSKEPIFCPKCGEPLRNLASIVNGVSKKVCPICTPPPLS